MMMIMMMMIINLNSANSIVSKCALQLACMRSNRKHRKYYQPCSGDGGTVWPAQLYSYSHSFCSFLSYSSHYYSASVVAQDSYFAICLLAHFRVKHFGKHIRFSELSVGLNGLLATRLHETAYTYIQTVP